MPRIIRSDFLMAPDADALRRKEKERIKMPIEKTKKLKKIRKREKN
jgi:hypothetical protein